MQPMPPTSQQQYVVPVAPLRSVQVNATRALGITQIVLGILCCALGVFALVFTDSWVRYIGFGIWGGAWFVVGGILGVCSAASPTNGCLNGTNMAFAILSTIAASVQIIFHSIGITLSTNTRYCWDNYTYTYYNCGHSNGAGIALYSILLLIVLMEFGVALAVAIYCCKTGCCQPASTGVIVQQPYQGLLVHSSGMVYSGQPTYVTGAVTSGVPCNPYANFSSQQTQQYQQRQISHTTTARYAQPANPTAMTYGQASAPGPGYQDKQGLGDYAPPPYSRE